MFNKIKADECSLFKYKNRCYTEIPKHMYIHSSIYDKDADMQVGILKKEIRLVRWLCMLVCICCVVLYFMQSTQIHKVSVQKKIDSYKDLVSLNIVNDKVNKANIIICLEYKGAKVTEWCRLKPGESIGNLPMQKKLKKGSYLCTLKYYIEGKYVETKKRYEVLLVVHD